MAAVSLFSVIVLFYLWRHLVKNEENDNYSNIVGTIYWNAKHNPSSGNNLNALREYEFQYGDRIIELCEGRIIRDVEKQKKYSNEFRLTDGKVVLPYRKALNSKEIKEYAQTYSEMDAGDAAKIFEAMTDDLKLVSRILSVMNAEARGEILAEMDPSIAAKLTKIMDPES